MLLASVAELRERLNVQDNAIYNRVLFDLLLNTTLGIETHLCTKFARRQYNTKFFAGADNYLVTGAPGRVGNTTPGVLYLLLDGINVSDLTVSISTTLTGSGSATASSNYQLDEAGIVSLFNGWLENDYINAAYMGGFDTATVDGNLVYQNVPTVLKQACLMFAEHVYMTKYGDSQVEDDLPQGEDYTDPPNAVIQILYQFNRTGANTLRSIL